MAQILVRLDSVRIDRYFSLWDTTLFHCFFSRSQAMLHFYQSSPCRCYFFHLFQTIALRPSSVMFTYGGVVLGFQHEAIKHLAETPAESALFSFNIHRACLLASQRYVRDLEAAAGADINGALSAAKMNFTSSVKLLAANLISNNHLYEGVEMLCSLGMHLEACRYLETYNEWGTAIWLAKVNLICPCESNFYAFFCSVS